jgi:hypothetical protein
MYSSSTEREPANSRLKNGENKAFHLWILGRF